MAGRSNDAYYTNVEYGKVEKQQQNEQRKKEEVE